MPADSNTPLLQLLLMGTGNDNNSWGDNCNSDVITRVETAVADALAIATTGGTLVLTQTQARYQTIQLTGTLASDLVITVPDTNKVYNIINSTVSGGFFVRLKCLTAATAVNIPGGSKSTRVVAISGVPYREDSCEVGRYVYDAASVTEDVLECTGAAVLRAALPELFAKIGTTYGVGNGVTTFNLPDGYTLGKFLRSRTAAVAVGTAQSNQNKSHTHTGSGTTSTESADHTHTGSGTTSDISAGHTHTGSGTTSGESVDHTHTGSGTSSGKSATHTHTTNYATAFVNAQSGAGSSNLWSGATAGGTTTSTESADHTHTYSFTTSGRSADHTHTYSFTTSGASVGHTHTYSFTTSGKSATHTHTYSFTTSTGSADGTEARPESLVGILCIRY